MCNKRPQVINKSRFSLEEYLKTMYTKLTIFFVIIYINLSVGDNFHEKKCDGSLKCLENEMIEEIDHLDNQKTIGLFGDFLFLQKNTESSDSARASEGLIARCIRYLTSHELKVKIPAEIRRNLHFYGDGEFLTYS